MAALTASRVVSWGAACTLLGGAALATGFAIDATQAASSYLVAFSYAVSLAVGSLFLLLIGRVVGAGWISVLGRVLESMALALIPLALLFVPLAAAAGLLYPWAAANFRAFDEHARRALEHKAGYMNLPSFSLRGALYFAVWVGAVLTLRSFARRRAAADAREQRALVFAKERSTAAVLLVLCSIAITLAAFDWLMSLDATWFSSMFGVYYFSGGFLAAIAAATLVALLARRSGEFADAFTRNHLHALGRMLLGFVVFWAYIGYFQVFLIEIADRPVEVTFYLTRTHGSWRGLTYLLMIGHFALPFLLLLPKALKFRGDYLAVVAAWLLLMHYVDLYWIVMPALHPAGIAPHWLDLAAMLAMFGVCLLCGGLAQRRRSLLDASDPLLETGIHYASHQ
jgi:hypothetical protein